MSSSERKEAIVREAIRLFSERGFRGTTTRELAAAVGVTEPVLYQHFATKRDLYTAIIDTKSREGHDKLGAELERYIEMNDDLGFFTRLGELAMDWYEGSPEFIRLLYFSALEGHELSEIAHERLATSFFEMIAGYIQRRIDAGALRQVDAKLAARSFVGMVAYYAIGTTIFRCPQTADRKVVISTMVSIFLDGMSARNVRE